MPMYQESSSHVVVAYAVAHVINMSFSNPFSSVPASVPREVLVLAHSFPVAIVTSLIVTLVTS